MLSLGYNDITRACTVVLSSAYLISSERLQYFGLVEARDGVRVAEGGRLVQQSQGSHKAVLMKLDLNRHERHLQHALQ